MTQTTNEFDEALKLKQKEQLDAMAGFLSKTHEQRVEDAKKSTVTNFGYSKPIISYANLFKLFGDKQFYFLPMPLGWDDAFRMGGEDFIPTTKINTKQMSEYGYSFYLHPFDERVAGSLVGVYGRKKDHAIAKYFFDIARTVKGKVFDDTIGMHKEVPYKDLNYTVKPVQMTNTVLIPGIVLIKHDLKRMVTKTVPKLDIDGGTEVDNEGRIVYEQKNFELDDFYIAEVGDIFEKKKTTLAEGAPKYKYIFLEITATQKTEYDKLKERYKNRTINIQFPDKRTVISDYRCKHPFNGCVLEFIKQVTPAGMTEYTVKDIPLDGLLLTRKNVNNEMVTLPTELGREVRDTLIEISPKKEVWESYSIKLQEQGKELTHFDIIRHLSSLPTLESMKLEEKMIGHQQIDFVINLMKESVDDFLKTTYPERYGAVVIDAVQQQAVPLSQTIPLTIPLVPQKQLPPATNPNDVASGDEMGDDLPF